MKIGNIIWSKYYKCVTEEGFKVKSTLCQYTALQDGINLEFSAFKYESKQSCCIKLVLESNTTQLCSNKSDPNLIDSKNVLI